MSAKTSIEWCDHTWNPWWGCEKVSPGCTNCYAEAWAKRTGHAVWGGASPRRFFGAAHWREPLAWNAAPAKAGERRRVFCASMADVFEDRRDLDAPRLQLFDLIRQTPNLDWLLLTKRPENILGLIERAMMTVPGHDDSRDDTLMWLGEWLGVEPPRNVWLGTSVENREQLRRARCLRRVPAWVRFLSIEPLLEDLGDLSGTFSCEGPPSSPGGNDPAPTSNPGAPDLVIVGGESGPRARPMHPAWVRSIRDQCEAAGVNFFFKQWGEYEPVTPLYDGDDSAENGRGVLHQVDTSGRVRGDYDGQPNDPQTWLMERVGKKAAGRLLDGRTWDEMPEVWS